MAGHAEDTRTSTLDTLGTSEGERRVIAFWQAGRLEMALPTSGTLVVGRSRECDLHIDHPSVSRKHLYIHVRPDSISVKDADSANGTKIRGRALVPGQSQVVAPGEAVTAGSAVLVFNFSARPQPQTATTSIPDGIVVADPAARRLHELVALVARGEINVLLLGETGAGKEVIARAVHGQSLRAEHPFVAINCAAVPESLFESELFGHERGAFTGALSTRAGHIEAANGGTLFLDEIGEMPLSAQAKLLRVIEQREIMRIGSSKPSPIDVRFIAATHRDLDEAVGEGRFRQDLFYRLNGITLVVPPLRERPAEIRLLAERFLAESCAKLGKAPNLIGPNAMQALADHSWPGNVRELRNVMDRAALLCPEGHTVGPEHVLLSPSGPPSSRSMKPPPAVLPTSMTPLSIEPLRGELGEIERQRIFQALEECGGNQTQAAKKLGISRRRLLNRLDDYGAPRPRKRT